MLRRDRSSWSDIDSAQRAAQRAAAGLDVEALEAEIREAARVGALARLAGLEDVASAEELVLMACRVELRAKLAARKLTQRVALGPARAGRALPSRWPFTVAHSRK